MYLPQWVVAAVTVFRAATQLDSPTNSLSIGKIGDFQFVAIDEDNDKTGALGVDGVKEGAVVRLLEYKRFADITKWSVFSVMRDNYLIKVNGEDLCLTGKTNGNECEEGVEGDLNLLKCPPDDMDWEHPALGAYWIMEDFKPQAVVEVQLAWTRLQVAYNLNKMSVMGKTNASDEETPFTIYKA